MVQITTVDLTFHHSHLKAHKKSNFFSTLKKLVRVTPTISKKQVSFRNMNSCISYQYNIASKHQLWLQILLISELLVSWEI